MGNKACSKCKQWGDKQPHTKGTPSVKGIDLNHFKNIIWDLVKDNIPEVRFLT